MQYYSKYEKPETIGPDKEILLPLLKAIEQHGQTLAALAKSLTSLSPMFIPSEKGFKQEVEKEKII